MKLSAVFVVEESCIKEILQMKEDRRMNYLLGLDENENFENYIIDMEDFMEMPSYFYTKVKNEILELSMLEEYNFNSIYCDSKHKICLFSMEQLSCVHDQTTHKENIMEKNYTFVSDDEEVCKIGLTIEQQTDRFINLLFTRRPSNHYILMVFDRDSMNVMA